MRSLPPGKLQNLRKLFENKDEEAGPPQSFGISFGASPPDPPGGTARPASSVQPRPAPRHLSPARKTYSGNGPRNGNSDGRQSQEVEKSVTQGVVPRMRRSRVSEKQEWSTLDRKSLAAASKRLSPTVSRRVSQFTAASDARDSSGNGTTDKLTIDHRLDVSLAARSGSPKRRSDPGSENESSKEEIIGRKNSGNRRRTVDNVELQSGATEEESESVKHSDRLKAFEKWSVSTDKPSLPKKPPPSLFAQRAGNFIEKTDATVGETYESPWDVAPGPNVERLRAISGEVSPKAITSSTQEQKRQPSGGQIKVNAALAPPRIQGSKSIARPTEQPPPPPSKPPRTFAHEDYLKVKLGISESQGTQDPTVKPVSQAVGEGGKMSVKDRISALLESGSVDNQEVTLRSSSADKNSTDRYSHLSQRSSEERETRGVREHPPSRPPPPRPRPVSEASALHQPHHLSATLGHRLAAADMESDSENEGPIVISISRGGRIPIRRHLSVSHRQPDDQLPEPPDKSDSLQRFPLRKSYSSECLNTGSLSSLSDFGGDDGSSSLASMTRSYHQGNNEGEPLYEAVIDEAGYAVPNEFVRLPPSAQPGLQAKHNLTSDKTSGRLKRIFAGPPSASVTPSPTPVKEQDIEKVSRKKMNLVRQKINQAYETLTVRFGRVSTSDGDQDVDQPDVAAGDRDSADSDSIVDAGEIKRRVTYCSTVRMKTLQSVRKAQEFMDKIYPQLFEHAVIVGLRIKTDSPGYEPYIIHKFPQTAQSNVSVPKFCFPDADQFRPGSAVAVSESYAFVLTNIDGGRLFGYCRRVQPRDSSLPEVICIISPIDAFNMYNKLLSEIEARRYKSLDHAQEVIAASFGRPLPSPGKVCHIRSLDDHGEMETLFLTRPMDCRLDNVNYESLLSYLGTEKLIKVFASMLMERHLILSSKHLSILTQTIHALGALLYPFHWQHVYIPILPPDMLDVCAAPMPFIIGVLHSHLARITAMELEDVFIVDLDRKQVLRSAGDEMTLLPKKVQKALKTALNMCKVDSDARNSQWLMVSEAFLRMFVETVGHFGQYISTQQDGTKTFQREQFMAGAPSKGIRQFLEWFSETQMFEVFMTMQLERQQWGSLDLFMSRLVEYSRGQPEASQSKGLGQRVKNIGKAIKTKLKEAT